MRGARCGTRWLAAFLGMMLVLAACGGGEAPVAEETTTAPAVEEETTEEDAAEEETAEQEAPAELASVRFGYQASLWGAPLILAEILEFWQQDGLEVTSQRFSAGKDVRDALLAGSVDAGSIGATPFVVAASTGELRMVAPAGYLGDTVAVVAQADSDIETVEDLRGKNVAARAGSITELIFLTKVLPDFGMSEADINLRNVSFDDHVAALTTGEVDAFVGLEPFISIAIEQGIGRSIIEFGQYDILPNVFAFDTDFVRDNEATVVEAVRAYFKVTELIQANFNEAAAALHEDFAAQGLQISQEALANALAKVDVNPRITGELRQYLDDQAALLIEEGRMEEVPNWDEVLAVDIQEQAMTDYWAER